MVQVLGCLIICGSFHITLAEGGGGTTNEVVSQLHSNQEQVMAVLWSMVYIVSHIAQILMLGAWGGHLHWKVVRGFAAVMSPPPSFFQGQLVLCLPIYHSCAPWFQFLEKLSIFSFNCGQTFSSQDANFPNVHSQDPSFYFKNLSPRFFFQKLVRHTPTVNS